MSAPSLLRNLALLVALTGCKGQSQTDGHATTNVGSSVPLVVTALPSSDVGSATASESATQTVASTDAALDAKLRVESERRQTCLRGPLSPSVEELPELRSHRHEVHGDKRERHLFVPPNVSKFDARRAEEIIEASRAQFPDLGNMSVRHCEGASHAAKAAKSFCVHLEVPICEAWLPKAEALLEALSPHGLGLLVEIVGRVGPRCVGNTCLPIGYHDCTQPREDLTWSGWFTLPYRAADIRTPLMPELAKGVCSSDGDCEIAGCGNDCEGWTEAPHGANCPAYGELADAFCGCVANACAWFVQPPALSLKAEVAVTGWQLSTRHDARELDRKTGDSVFRELLEGPWLRRQLERVKHERDVTIPSAFTLDLTLNRRFQVARAKVAVDAKPGPSWLEELLLNLPVPVPDITSPGNGPKPVHVTGRVSATSK